MAHDLENRRFLPTSLNLLAGPWAEPRPNRRRAVLRASHYGGYPIGWNPRTHSEYRRNWIRFEGKRIVAPLLGAVGPI